MARTITDASIIETYTDASVDPPVQRTRTIQRVAVTETTATSETLELAALRNRWQSREGLAAKARADADAAKADYVAAAGVLGVVARL